MTEQTPNDPIAEFSALCFQHPNFKHIVALLGNCHHDSKRTSEPLCALIEGDTGVGKTTIVNTYCANYPRQILPTGTKVPVISTEIPEAATPGSLVGTLLSSLGDPFPDKGTAVVRTRRLKQLLKECATELIILDEFQHFIDRRSEFAITKISDWLKGLINDTKIPVVLVGMPNSHEVLDFNPQLKRRFAYRQEIFPFGWKTDEQKKEFRKLLLLFAQKIPHERKPSLSEEEMAYRFYIATGGKISAVKNLLVRALFLAEKRQDEELTTEHLALAYEEQNGQENNPFIIKTNLLTKLKPPAPVKMDTSGKLFNKQRVLAKAAKF